MEVVLTLLLIYSFDKYLLNAENAGRLNTNTHTNTENLSLTLRLFESSKTSKKKKKKPNCWNYI